MRKCHVPKDMRRGLNILVSRYVLANKNVRTKDESKEAHLVVQVVRMRDNFYSSLFKFAPAVTKASTRILLAVSAGMRYRLGTRDVSQAYICTPHPLLRRVSVVPPPEYDAEENDLWELMHPLYSLPESGEMWYSTYAKYRRELMGMHPTRIDPAVFARHDGDGKVERLTVLQVGDSLVTGTKVFLAQEEHESKLFQPKGGQ
jgi:Reverse transcriptase (RNA-dependent DNA polymerase)